MMSFDFPTASWVIWPAKDQFTSCFSASALKILETNCISLLRQISRGVRLARGAQRRALTDEATSF